MNESDKIILVFSGVRFDESDKVGLIRMRNAFGVRPEYNLLLIQAAHRKTADRWIERKECVSDDLFYTFWKKMTGKGEFAVTHKITCEWCNHPNQRHKITGERFRGGLNKYREYYKVKHPIRIRTTNYKIIDENEQYAPFRKKHIVPEDHLKILLVGDLAYNAERIYAFEEAGHKLYGLWSLPAFCYSTVGPLPFGNVENISYENWRNQIKEINPDIIYAQLSSGAIKIAHEVMEAKTGIPFVWHFKEGPHEAMKWGLWDKLIDLYTYADGKIYLNDNIKEWYEIFTPSHSKYQHTYILDPELPKSNCLGNNFSEKISARNENEIHTVVIGRIIGISPQEMFILAAHNIHIHVYNQNYVSEERTLAKYILD